MLGTAWYISDFACLDSDLEVDIGISEAVKEARQEFELYDLFANNMPF